MPLSVPSSPFGLPLPPRSSNRGPPAMAVEAHNLRLFPSRAIAGSMEDLQAAGVVYGAGAAHAGFYSTPYGVGFPAGGVVPFCNPAAVVSVDASDSGLTFNDLSAASSSQSRKRQRAAPSAEQLQVAPSESATFSFLGEDITSTIQQQQLEVDRLVAQHTEKVRREVAERRRQFSRRVAAAVEGWVVRRIRAKEEEIEKMGKLNNALEDRVRSLCVENQIWKDLAHTNEVAANALRSNLEQVLAQAAARPHHPAGDGADDAESCCDNIAGGGGRREGAAALCRRCGVGEPSVLLLPCRHLCLCAGCGPAVVSCPVCRGDKNGSVNVNLS